MDKFPNSGNSQKVWNWGKAKSEGDSVHCNVWLNSQTTPKWVLLWSKCIILPEMWFKVCNSFMTHHNLTKTNKVSYFIDMKKNLNLPRRRGRGLHQVRLMRPRREGWARWEEQVYGLYFQVFGFFWGSWIHHTLTGTTLWSPFLTLSLVIHIW
jgi:hypothetical protein